MMQADMFAKAKAKYDDCVEKVTTWDDFMAALNNKHMCLAPWADEEEVRAMPVAGPHTRGIACSMFK